jgi:hypothetical protein
MRFSKMELTKQRNYEQSLDLACATLRGTDPEERAQKAGATHQGSPGGEEIRIDFFGGGQVIRFPEMSFSAPEKKTVSLVTRVIVLHYLIHADGSPLMGKWVGYKDIRGGLLYAGVFARRVTEPLVRTFGRSAGLFQEAGLRSGGIPAGIGDASFTLSALPRIPLQFVLWEGDEEFPPSVQVLFDASVDHYLPLEDVVVLGQMAAGRLIHRSTHP